MADSKPMREIGADGATLVLDVASGIPAGSALRLGSHIFLEHLGRIGQSRFDRAYQHLVEQWALLGEIEDEWEAERQLRHLTQEGDPELDETLHRAFKAMSEATSSATWPYIARLTALYLYNKRPTNMFFRSMSSFLTKAEESDILLMREAVVLSREVYDEKVGLVGEANVGYIEWTVHSKKKANPAIKIAFNAAIQVLARDSISPDEKWITRTCNGLDLSDDPTCAENLLEHLSTARLGIMREGGMTAIRKPILMALFELFRV